MVELRKCNKKAAPCERAALWLIGRSIQFDLAGLSHPRSVP